MKTMSIPIDHDYIAPDGAEIRLLLRNTHGGICHCNLRNGKVSRAVQHKTVSEFWHIISGKGEIWRKLRNEESIVLLEPGITIDISMGTEFQYRSIENDLEFICVTNPPWPGHDESIEIKNSPWQPTVSI